MIRKEFFLYDKENGEKEIIIPNDVSLIKIEVPSGINITMQGKLTRESDLYSNLMGIKSKDLKSYLTITDGIFTIEVNGLYSVKFNSDSECSIKIRLIG